MLRRLFKSSGMLLQLATQVGLLLVLLILADVALWIVHPIANVGIPVRIAKIQTIDGLKPEILYSTIGHGVRSASVRSLQKVGNSIRLLCIGASTTDQATQDSEDTWCAHLESEARGIAGAQGIDFHAISYGKGGDRVVDTARWLRRMIDEIKPDLVITLLGINDLVWNGSASYRPRRVEDADASPPKTGVFQYLSRRCPEVSQVCRLMESVWGIYVMRADIARGRVLDWNSATIRNMQVEYRRQPFVEALVRNPDPIDEFREGASWLFQFLAAHHLPAIVLGQPVLWARDLPEKEYDSLWFSVATAEGRVRPSLGWLSEEMIKYNDVQKVEAYRFGFEYVDLDASIPKTREYFFDDCHFTDAGSARVAQVVAPTLKSALARLVESKLNSHPDEK